MNRTSELLRSLRQEPEELEWATAKGPKRDKSHDIRYASSSAMEAQKPLALLGRYCSEGKISHGHIDDRYKLQPSIRLGNYSWFAALLTVVCNTPKNLSLVNSGILRRKMLLQIMC